MMTDDREINELLEVMMHAATANLSSILYGYDRVGPGGQEILLRMIERLREPGHMEKLRIQARRTAGRFELVIVNAPWKPPWSADGFLPLLVGRHDSRLQVLGYVLPFNPVMGILTAGDRKDVFSLASYWADWLESYKKGQAFS